MFLDKIDTRNIEGFDTLNCRNIIVEKTDFDCCHGCGSKKNLTDMHGKDSTIEYNNDGLTLCRRCLIRFIVRLINYRQDGWV